MKTKHHDPKSMGHSKISSKKEVYINTNLLQETNNNNNNNNQPNFKPKGPKKRKQSRKLVEERK